MVGLECELYDNRLMIIDLLHYYYCTFWEEITLDKNFVIYVYFMFDNH